MSKTRVVRIIHILDFCLAMGILIAVGCGRSEEAAQPVAANKPPPALDDKQLLAAMEPLRPQLLGCCNNHETGESPNSTSFNVGLVPHSCAIGLVIDADGKVVETSAAGSSGATGERDCLEQTARMAKFPPMGRSATYASYWMRCGPNGEGNLAP